MKYLVMIYTDSSLMNALPAPEFESTMRGCLAKADELRHKGRLLDSQMLEGGETAKTIRIRGGRQTILDGPFAETKELLAGFNLIEAENMDEAIEIAMQFPWASTGAIEVRPILEIATMRRRVGAA